MGFMGTFPPTFLSIKFVLFIQKSPGKEFIHF